MTNTNIIFPPSNNNNKDVSNNSFLYNINSHNTDLNKNILVNVPNELIDNNSYKYTNNNNHNIKPLDLCRGEHSIKTNKNTNTLAKDTSFNANLRSYFANKTYPPNFNNVEYQSKFNLNYPHRLLNCSKYTKDPIVTQNNNPFSSLNHSSYFEFNSAKPHSNPAKSILPPPKTFVSPIKQPQLKKQYIKIDMDIKTIDDIITIINLYPIMDHIEYSIDMKSLHKIKEPLNLLNNMIGMQELKNSILDQIIYYMQGFHKINNGSNDFMHTVIYGPPGTGKTEIAKLIGKIFSKLGILSRETFKKVTRSDLVAGYLGQTALKTQSVIRESLGGVLFIDEAYALGNQEKRDTFAKECIDTLCESLSDHKDSIMVIIAGYEHELQKCFFDYNQGLESRFTWRFKTDLYTAHELRLIFIKKVYDAKWSFLNKNEIPLNWFDKKLDNLKSFGRDIETLFAKTKICHSRRLFGNTSAIKTVLTLDDINAGYNLYISNEYSKKSSEIINNLYI